jgi:hypothetical protein
MKTVSRNSALFCLMTAAAALALPACDGGGDGEGGSAGSTTTEPSGGGGAGGDGGGGAGGTGGTAMGKPDGDPCLAGDECESGFCLTQAEFGFPNGYCTGACNSFVECATGSECIFFQNEPFCFKSCSAPASCGAGQQCLEIDPGTGLSVCAPGCTMDAECEGFGVCDENSGFCVIPEDCDVVGDEDGDGLSDCEDGECAMKCQAQIDMACGAAVTLTLGAAQMGDNNDGTSIFNGTCSGSGNNEDVYKLTIPDGPGGILDISLVSDADLAIWANTTCGMPSEIGCTDQLAGGTEPELLTLTVTGGQTLFVYVDGSSFQGATGNQGPYTLSTSILATQPETEPNNDLMTASTVSLASLPTAASGDLDQVNDNDDWFLLDTSMLAGNKTITAETVGFGTASCGPNGDVDTYLEIVADTGTVLDPVDPMMAEENEDISGFSNWCSLAEIADAPPGKYYLHVRTSALCVPDPMGPDCVFPYAIKVNIQ